MILCHSAGVLADSDSLVQQFADPPQSARPHTWWHWMNGNITREGVEKDLQWLHSIGMGGVQNFNVSLNTPRIVEKPLDFMTPAWKEAFQVAVRSASEKGMDFAIAASPGWSEPGGPGVEPKDGMKKLVWSQVTIQGGETFNGKLPFPPRAIGPYLDVEFHDPLAMSEEAARFPEYYGDAKVLAFPVIGTELPVPTAFNQNGEQLAVQALLDDELGSTGKLVKGDSSTIPALIYEYDTAVTVRSATVFLPHAKPPFREPDYLPMLEVADGDQWRKLAELPLAEVPTTVSFPATTGHRFRLLMARNESIPETLGEGAPGVPSFDIFARPDSGYIDVGQWALSAENRVHNFETKAGFSVSSNYYDLGVGGAQDATLSADQVIDLTDRVGKDGALDWQAPTGNDWRILRLGYSLTGKTNHPAPVEATGLEVDKYDARAVRDYLETYLAMYKDAVGSDLVGEKGVNALLTDSIEVGASNWTGSMIEKFQKLRGYDPTPWLPVLTGMVIGTVRQSEAFLYDFRKTLADLLAGEHYATVAKVAQQASALPVCVCKEVWVVLT